MLQEASGAAGHPSYRRYHYGEGPLLVQDGGGRRFISTDALGSTTDLTTTGATVASMRKYDAWGQYRNETAPVANEPKLGFTGHQYDPETGLVYARARYYDPDLGRFLSRDTYEGSLNEAPSLHRYAYAWMNPLRFRDSSGHQVKAAEMVEEDESGLPPVEFSDQKVYEAEQKKAAADEQERAKESEAGRARLAECRARGECQKDTFVAGEPDGPTGQPENDDPESRLGEEERQTLEVGRARREPAKKVGEKIEEAKEGTETGMQATAPGAIFTAFTGKRITGGSASEQETREARITAGVTVAIAGGAAAFKVVQKLRAAAALRKEYVATAEELGALAQRLKASGASAEEVVRELSPLRNELKLNIRERDSWLSARLADLRNYIKYGNRAGPSPEDLYEQYGSWEKALEAISRTNQQLNRAAGVKP